MEVINNLFSSNQHRSKNDPSVISSNSGNIRYKWPHRRKRTKPHKKVEGTTESAWGLEVGSDVGPAVATPTSAESFPGLVRVPADDCCVVCANDVEFVYVLHKCGHRACLNCWRTFASSQVSSFAMAHITCIACDCKLSRALTIQLLKPPTYQSSSSSNHGIYPPLSKEQLAAAEKLYQRYEDFLLHQCLLHDKHTRWCPRGCGYAVLANRGFRACPRIECLHPDCQGGAFCYKCRGSWESTNSCDHICRQSNNPTSVAAAKVATGGGADVSENGEISPEDNGHRTLFSRLQQILRLPTAAAATRATSDANSGGGSRQKLVVESNSDLEKGGLPSSLTRRPSDRRFSTPAIPLQAAVDSAESNTEDEWESKVAVNKASEVDISKVELDLPEDLNGQVKPCPRCKTLLLKLDDGSCNHMSCFICGCEFCWLCLREVRDTHFLSPTGCTFWGRARWPFRRRIWAMLLAAFGTPFILAIVTALAVPGIAIGFPAYLVYKVGKQVEGSKCKRILLKTLSFFGGLLVSPVIAALVALFGIPLVLIYVYIFMPITLFSELKVRLSSESSGASSSGESDARTDMTAIDPKVGFKINWDRVGESATAAATTSSSSAYSSSAPQKDSSVISPMPSRARSIASMEVLHEKTMMESDL